MTVAAALLAAALALVAGFCDGSAYLRWHAFAANMTGNTVLLGLAAYQGHAGPILRSLCAIGSLMVGAGCAAALRTRFSPAVPLIAEALVLALASFAGRQPLQLDILAFAMGLQNQSVTTFAGVKLNTSFITGDYTQLGTSLVDLVLGRDRAKARRRIALVVTLVIAYAGGGTAAAFAGARLPHGLFVVVAIVLLIAYAAWRGAAADQPASQA